MRLMDDGDTLYMYLQRSRFPFVYASTDAREVRTHDGEVSRDARAAAPDCELHP